MTGSVIWAFIKPFLPQIMIGIALFGAFAWWSNHEYNKGIAAANARFEQAEKAAAERQAEMAQAITDAVTAIGASLDKNLAANAAVGGQSKTIIQKEIDANPRLSDPAQGLTPAMVDAINKARAQSHD